MNAGFVKACPEIKLCSYYSIHVARSVEQVEEIRCFWEKMQQHPHADIDFYLALLAARREILRPHVILLALNGRVISLLIGRIENIPFACKIGYKIVAQPPVRSLTIVYGGILGDPSRASCAVLLAELMNTLARGEAEIVFMNHLAMDGLMYRSATTMPGFLCRDHACVPNDHWRISLAGSYDKFCATLSKNTKHNLRRYSQRLRTRLDERLKIKCYRHAGDMEQIVRESETVSRKTYQRGLGAGFVENGETLRRLALGLQRRRFRAYILYDGDQPCAFWNGIEHGKVFYTGTTGYDPAYEECRPGAFLLNHMIEDFCREGKIEAIDFGFGDAQYKRSFGDQNWREASVCIFPFTARGLRLSVLRTATVALTQMAKYLLQRWRVLQKIKWLWRKRLRSEAEVK
jgi:hypothetical protein